jgi:hypothetical protein
MRTGRRRPPFTFDSAPFISLTSRSSGPTRTSHVVPADPTSILRKASATASAALRGAEALATILDFSEDGNDSDLDLLITKCYTWGSALKSLTWQAMYPS